jgi:hypothetical protein
VAGQPLAQVPQVRQRFRLPSGNNLLTFSLNSPFSSLTFIASFAIHSSSIIFFFNTSGLAALLDCFYMKVNL